MSFYRTPDPMNLVNLIQLIFPNRGFVEIDTIRIALEKVGPRQMSRIPWNPISDLRDPDGAPKITRRVPVGYGVDDASKHFHGGALLKLPLTRAWRLLPSPEGAGTTEPSLYTCHYREVLLWSYSEPTAVPFVLADGSMLWKKFRCLLGVSSLHGHPYHDQKLVTRSKYHNQFLFRKGSYQELWVEIIPYETDEGVSIDRTEALKSKDKMLKAYVRRSKQAKGVIWDITDKHFNLGDPPELHPLPGAVGPAKRQSAKEFQEQMPEPARSKSADPQPPRRKGREEFWETATEEPSIWQPPWRRTKDWYYGPRNDSRAKENEADRSDLYRDMHVPIGAPHSSSDVKDKGQHGNNSIRARPSSSDGKDKGQRGKNQQHRRQPSPGESSTRRGASQPKGLPRASYCERPA